MLKFKFCLFLIFISGLIQAMPIKVGIYHGAHIRAFLLKTSSGSYSVMDGNAKIALLENNTLLKLVMEGTEIQAYIAGDLLGSFKHLSFIPTDQGSGIRVKPVGSGPVEESLDSRLDFFASGGEIRLINQIDIENYVAGVLEGEIGMNKYPEFLKVQSVICRTYAVSNLGRHKSEGFDLCDKVHCQVYKGKLRFNLLIPKAVNETSGKIIIDQSGKPIIAAFHSNCGGQTYNSEDIWPSYVPYLRSVKDTFCIDGRHASWKEMIRAEDWRSYIRRQDTKRSVTDEDLNSLNYVTSTKGPYYSLKSLNIPVKAIRNDWNFKSSCFSIIHQKDSLLISGKGYGHGIGMCQEGAMKMAEKGYKFEDIIRHYYTQIRIATIDSVFH